MKHLKRYIVNYLQVFHSLHMDFIMGIGSYSDTFIVEEIMVFYTDRAGMDISIGAYVIITSFHMRATGNSKHGHILKFSAQLPTN